MGLPAEPETAMSVRAYGRQTCHPSAACAAATCLAVRPRRLRNSLAFTPALRSFAIWLRVPMTSIVRARRPSLMS